MSLRLALTREWLPPSRSLRNSRIVHISSRDIPICIRDGEIVDFGKRIVGKFDAMGEWPGFMKVSAATGPLLAASLENLVDGVVVWEVGLFHESFQRFRCKHRMDGFALFVCNMLYRRHQIVQWQLFAFSAAA